MDTLPPRNAIISYMEPWYGPGELPVNVTISMTVQDAINMCRNTHPERIWSDTAALEHFITVSWATLESEK